MTCKCKYTMIPCPFCGSEIRHIESEAKSFDPPRIYHEWHHIEDDHNCPIRRQIGFIVASADDNQDRQDKAMYCWNRRTPPQETPRCSCCQQKMIEYADADHNRVFQCINIECFSEDHPVCPPAAGVPIAWRWRCHIGGQWGTWQQLDQPVEEFKLGPWSFNLANGTAELQPLYAAPHFPADTSAAQMPDYQAIRKVIQRAWDNSRDGFEIDTMTDAVMDAFQEHLKVVPAAGVTKTTLCQGCPTPDKCNKYDACIRKWESGRG